LSKFAKTNFVKVSFPKCEIGKSSKKSLRTTSHQRPQTHSGVWQLTRNRHSHDYAPKMKERRTNLKVDLYEKKPNTWPLMLT